MRGLACVALAWPVSAITEAGRNKRGAEAMNLPTSEERYWDCVKDLDGTLHLGGYPARAVVIEYSQGWFHLYKADIDPSKAINLARSIARNEPRWYRIHCVNQKLKTRVDTISRADN